MKNRVILITIILALMMSLCVINIHAEDDDTFSYYVIEESTGAMISEHNANSRHEIASMVKIMSLNIIFEEIEKGNLKLNDDVLVSKYAASQTGSELFLDAGINYKVDDLIKGIVVVSANDATMALAEKIANNEDNFVKIMNDKAAEWKLTDTKFVNPTGLPKNGQYSSAHDVTIMMKNLLSHEKYFDYAKIWCEDYKHPSGRITNLTNTNKLIRFYDGCDAGKTGYTDKAGFCLSCSAERQNVRLLTTVIGCPSSKVRFREASNLLNDGFKRVEYSTIKKQSELIDNDIKVKRSRKKELKLSYAHDINSISIDGKKSNIKIEYSLPQYVVAPIKKGDVIGKCKIISNGKEVDTVDIISLDDIEVSSLFDEFKDLASR